MHHDTLETRISEYVPEDKLKKQEDAQRTRFYGVIGVMAILMVASLLWGFGSSLNLGSGAPAVTGYMVYTPPEMPQSCTKPYIPVCCLDENANGVCDSEEARIAAQIP